MSLLQTAGIASQRGREIDRENAAARRADLQEAAARKAMDAEAAEQYFLQVIMQERARRQSGAPPAQAAAAAPAVMPPGGALGADPAQAADVRTYAVPDPVLPERRPLPGMKNGGKVKGKKPKGYADGGMVPGPKFSGVFDAAQFRGELPDIYKDMLADSGLDIRTSDWPRQLGSMAQQHAVAQRPAAPPTPPMPDAAMRKHDPYMDDRARMMLASQAKRYNNGGSVQSYDPQGQDSMPQAMGMTPGGTGGAEGGHPYPGFRHGGALGGMIQGPGSGTSDSIPATVNGREPIRVSDGEFIIPADVVRAKGEEFFNKLLEKHHRRA